MEWKELSAKANIRSDRPTIGIMKNGRISWNRATQEALGKPDKVILLFDPKRRRLALQKTDINEPGKFFRVSKAPKQASWGISAQGALRSVGIEVDRAFRRGAKDYGDGVWGIEIGELFEDKE